LGKPYVEIREEAGDYHRIEAREMKWLGIDGYERGLKKRRALKTQTPTPFFFLFI